MTPTDQIDANKRLVLDFYRCVFEGHNADAARDFVTDEYVQHAGHIESGRVAFEHFVRGLFPDGPVPVPPELLDPPTFVVAERNMVVVAKLLPQPEPGQAGSFYDYYVFDAFRIERGKIAEHWSSVNKIAPPRHGVD